MTPAEITMLKRRIDRKIIEVCTPRLDCDLNISLLREQVRNAIYGGLGAQTLLFLDALSVTETADHGVNIIYRLAAHDVSSWIRLSPLPAQPPETIQIAQRGFNLYGDPLL